MCSIAIAADMPKRPVHLLLAVERIAKRTMRPETTKIVTARLRSRQENKKVVTVAVCDQTSGSNPHPETADNRSRLGVEPKTMSKANSETMSEANSETRSDAVPESNETNSETSPGTKPESRSKAESKTQQELDLERFLSRMNVEVCTNQEELHTKVYQAAEILWTSTNKLPDGKHGHAGINIFI